MSLPIRGVWPFEEEDPFAPKAPEPELAPASLPASYAEAPKAPAAPPAAPNPLAERIERLRQQILAERDDGTAPAELAAAQQFDTRRASMDRASDALAGAFSRKPVQSLGRGPSATDQLLQRQGLADRAKAGNVAKLKALQDAEADSPTGMNADLQRAFYMEHFPEVVKSIGEERFKTTRPSQLNSIFGLAKEAMEYGHKKSTEKARLEKETRDRQEQLSDMDRREEVAARRAATRARVDEHLARITAAGQNTAVQTKIQGELSEERRKANIIDFEFLEPMAPPTPDDAKKVKEAAAAFAKLRVAAEALSKEAAKHSGVTDFGRLTPEAQKTINSLHQNLQDQYRTVAGLGVPNNSDLKLMARAVDDPGEFWSIVMGTTGKATDTLLQANRGMLNAFAEQYGYRYRPGSTLSSGSQKAEPEAGVRTVIKVKDLPDGTQEVLYDDETTAIRKKPGAR